MTNRPTGKGNTASKLAGAPRRGARRLELPAVLGKPLPPFAAPDGASPFAVAQTHATPNQVHRALEVAGPISPEACVRYYQETSNPVWLWMGLSLSRSPEEMPPEVFAYLRRAAKEVFDRVVEQAGFLETVQILEGETPEEGIVRQPRRAPVSPDVSQLLGLSRPGQNPFQAAAKDLRAISLAIAAEELGKNNYGYEEACAVLATINGRVSADTGPAVSWIKQLVTWGKKLIAACAVKGPE